MTFQSKLQMILILHNNLFEQVPIIKQNSTTIGASWVRKFKETKGQFVLALSTNKLKNIFSRYSDNENLEGLYFRNDSHEWKQKLEQKRQAILMIGNNMGRKYSILTISIILLIFIIRLIT